METIRFALTILGTLFFFIFIFWMAKESAEMDAERRALRYQLTCDDGYESGWHKTIIFDENMVKYRGVGFELHSMYVIPEGVTCTKEAK